MKIKILKITTKEAQGKNGPYTRMGIKCQEYGDKWLSGFLNKTNEHWQEGDTVDVDIQDVFKDGKNYINFRPLTKFDLMERRILILEEAVKALQNGKSNSPIVTNDEPDFDAINAELAG